MQGAEACVRKGKEDTYRGSASARADCDTSVEPALSTFFCSCYSYLSGYDSVSRSIQSSRASVRPFALPHKVGCRPARASYVGIVAVEISDAMWSLIVTYLDR